MAVVAGRRVLCRACAARPDPWLDGEFPDQEMGGGRAVRRDLHLLLSSAEVATQRSFMMTAVVLIAVMVDRRTV
jgi:competence protein ComEC